MANRLTIKKKYSLQKKTVFYRWNEILNGIRYCSERTNSEQVLRINYCLCVFQTALTQKTFAYKCKCRSNVQFLLVPFWN